MDKRNRELANQQRAISMRFDIISEDYVDILGYKLKASSDEKDMARQIQELMEHLTKVIPENILDVDSSKILQVGSIYECIGLGLRKQRNKDKEYAKMVRELDTYRNLVTDTKLNELIQLHVFSSEAFSNVLLVNAIPDAHKQEFMQILPQDVRIKWQGGAVEPTIIEIMWDIRTRIGERIKEIGKMESQNDAR